MQTATAFSTSSNTEAAIKTAYTDLVSKLGGAPSWMTIHTTFQHPAEIVTKTLESLAPGVPYQGGTTCNGLMTEAGHHSENGVALGLFGIKDSEGVYSIGYAETDTTTRMTGRAAIKMALDASKKDGPPALIWITVAPGSEEDILMGVDDGLVASSTPIIGGSSADNTIEGNWYQITNGQVMKNGVVITAMYPSKPIRYAFDNSYNPTTHSGIITRAQGRTVYEINRRPAAKVYNEWSGGVINEFIDGGNILAASTLKPLAREANWVRGATLYQTTHPESVTEDHALTLFTKAERGEKLVLMEGTTHDLVYSVDRVTSKALHDVADPAKTVAGALVIYCAGCMLAVQDDMPEVSKEFSKALGGQPFLGVYTFGEQGCALLGENSHANLMMSMVVFEQ